jgi:hypothetical protein
MTLSPPGPLLFCLWTASIHDLELAHGCMDGFTVGGPEELVAGDVDLFFRRHVELGLHLNVSE